MESDSRYKPIDDNYKVSETRAVKVFLYPQNKIVRVIMKFQLIKLIYELYSFSHVLSSLFNTRRYDRWDVSWIGSGSRVCEFSPSPS